MPAVTRLLPLALLLAALPAAAQRVSKEGAGSARADRIVRDIAALADDSMEGRMTGAPGNDRAAAYVAAAFRALKLRTVLTDAAGKPTYLQRFAARGSGVRHAGLGDSLLTQNVVALIPGTDRRLRGQAVVLGAHFDHLGRSPFFATDPKAGDAIRNGADDNASGTAAVIELARLLSAHPPKRSVLLVAFSGEELGLLGSQWFVNHPPVPIDSVAAMLNFDMVGRLQNDRLIVYGVATADELPALVDSVNATGPLLSVKGIGDGFGPSDQSSFYERDVPVLHFFTDQHPDYHAATDDVERINAPGEARVVDLALGVARAIADRPGRLTFRRSAAPARTMAGDPAASGTQPYLGSVPDMAADDGAGLRLSGVSPGSPAEKGGLKAGDVVVELDGKAVTDLETYAAALYARKPGDTIRIVVVRPGAAGTAPERVTVSVTLGRRGE